METGLVLASRPLHERLLMYKWRAYGVTLWTCKCETQHRARSVITESTLTETSKVSCPKCGDEKTLSGALVDDSPPTEAVPVTTVPQSPSGEPGRSEAELEN